MVLGWPVPKRRERPVRGRPGHRRGKFLVNTELSFTPQFRLAHIAVGISTTGRPHAECDSETEHACGRDNRDCRKQMKSTLLVDDLPERPTAAVMKKQGGESERERHGRGAIGTAHGHSHPEEIDAEAAGQPCPE